MLAILSPLACVRERVAYLRDSHICPTAAGAAESVCELVPSLRDSSIYSTSPGTAVPGFHITPLRGCWIQANVG